MELVREQFEARNRRVLPDVTASNRLRRRLRFARKAGAGERPWLSLPMRSSSLDQAASGDIAYSRSPTASRATGLSGMGKGSAPQNVGVMDVTDDLQGAADRARDDHGRCRSRSPEGEAAERTTTLSVV
jgi:hypothetical protein